MNIDQSINIRDFKTTDYDNMISLWKAAGLPYRPKGRDSRKKIEHELKFGCTVAAVADHEGELVGSVWGTHDGRKGWLNRLAVRPEFRNKGLARLLVEYVEKRLTELGIDIIGVLVEDWNKDSMEVFEKLGYVKHKDIFYYSKRKNDEV
jgi:ribosomal protein S18 acetylase RimI-like enzyme